MRTLFLWAYRIYYNYTVFDGVVFMDALNTWIDAMLYIDTLTFQILHLFEPDIFWYSYIFNCFILEW